MAFDDQLQQRYEIEFIKFHVMITKDMMMLLSLSRNNSANNACANFVFENDKISLLFSKFIADIPRPSTVDRASKSIFQIY